MLAHNDLYNGLTRRFGSFVAFTWSNAGWLGQKFVVSNSINDTVSSSSPRPNYCLGCSRPSKLGNRIRYNPSVRKGATLSISF